MFKSSVQHVLGRSSFVPPLLCLGLLASGCGAAPSSADAESLDADLGSAEQALQLVVGRGRPAVDPNLLQARVLAVSSEGALCPPGSIASALSATGAAVTVTLSEALSGRVSAACKLNVDLEVPAGFALRMPTTILRGFATASALDRRYSFVRGGSAATTGRVESDYVIDDPLRGLLSPSCRGTRRVRYVIDVTARLTQPSSFFALDSVDIDTAFRFGTDWALCDGTPVTARGAGG
jgi:Domain of unknown function (DUF4360)